MTDRQKKLRIAFLDDDVGFRLPWETKLAHADKEGTLPNEARFFATPEAMIGYLQENEIDVLITDVFMDRQYVGLQDVFRAVARKSPKALKICVGNTLNIGQEARERVVECLGSDFRPSTVGAGDGDDADTPAARARKAEAAQALEKRYYPDHFHGKWQSSDALMGMIKKRAVEMWIIEPCRDERVSGKPRTL